MDDESLAALADGTPATEAQKRHLGRCRSCAGSYAEAIRFRVRGFASIRSGKLTVAPPHRDVNSNSRLGARSLQLLGALALVTLVLLAPRLWRSSDNPVPPPDIRSLLEGGSARSLVLLGGEGVDPEMLVTYRSVDPADDPDIDRVLLAWSRGLRAGTTTHAETVWLVGGLAARGLLYDAAAVLEIAYAQWPRDRDLAVLDAVLAWREGRDSRAELLLQQVLAEDPGHSVARYNLGWMLVDLHRPDDARDHLRRVAREQNGHPLGRRAAALIRTIDGN